MESMRRSEANSSHHPNKVAVNNLATESNKQLSGSGSSNINNNNNNNNNKNKLSFSQQATNNPSLQPEQVQNQQQGQQKKGVSLGVWVSSPASSSASASTSSSTSSTTSSSSSSGASTSSESKDTNFEYDDNEWDVGGIGDLIIDLDADIEKSSSTAANTQLSQSQNQQNQSQSEQSQHQQHQQQQQVQLNTLSPPISGLGGSIGNNNSRSQSSNSSSTGSGTTTTGSAGGNLTNINEKAPQNDSVSSLSNSSSSSPITVASTTKSSSSFVSPSFVGSSIQHQQNTQKQSSAITTNTSVGSNNTTLISAAASASSSKHSNSKQTTKSQQNPKHHHHHHSHQTQQQSLLSQLSNNNSNNKSNNNKVGLVDNQKLTLATAATSFVPSSSSRSNNSTSQGNNTLGNNLPVHQQVICQSKLVPSAFSMSSQAGSGQAAGKSATKMSIDHQATLDKGLKMKIKRTKPGTKTSEAKHEIVKAEQNGTSTMDDTTNISSNNSSSGKKHSQQVNTTSSVQVLPPIQQQGTKRGNSSHRRDKTRDKIPHSRDKSEHNNSSNNNTSNNSSSNSSNSSNNNTSSNTSTGLLSNNSNSERSSATLTSSSCSCSPHDVQMNGLQSSNSSCTSISCIRNKTSQNLDQSNTTPLSQRIGSNSSNSNNSNNMLSGSTNSSNLVPSSNSTSNVGNVFVNSSNSGNIQTSSSGTPNAPGPPKESKTSSNGLSNHQQSTQIPNTNNAMATNISQQQSQQQHQQQLSQSQQLVSQQHQQQQQQTQQQTQSQSETSSSSFPGTISGPNPKTNSNNIPAGSISATVHHTVSVASNSSLVTSLSNCDDANSSPPPKKIRCDPKDMVDICVGTSVGTITEPDCLGPCEPGTSVTLEGIVWHETEGGVLVVNVTWRGKTYVGTLLDCTRHDWAPPRFCDSPTEELDSRTPKGRGKRGRNSVLTPDLSNFTETRSSVHSKLRNGGAKGRGGRTMATANTTSTTTTTTVSTSGNSSSSSSNSGTNTNTPSASPTAFLPPRPEKRKSKDESPSPVNGESSVQCSQSQNLVNPVTGLNVQISTKKCKTSSPGAVSPVLLECPEQDCSKKYKHANGLRYHQSHAHGSGSMDEDSLQLPESPRVALPSTPSPAPASTPQPQIPSSSLITSTQSNSSAVVSVCSSIASSSPSSTISTTAVSSGMLPISAASTQPSGIHSSNAGGLLAVQAPTSVTESPLIGGPSPQLPPQHTVPGGSITAGISGQALSQQHSLLLGSTPNSSNLLTSTNPIMSTDVEQPQPQSQSQIPMASQQQTQPGPAHLNAASNISSTPTRGDPPSKIKPGVLRFGPPPENLSGNQNSLPNQSPLRPTPTASVAPNSGSPNTPESAHQPPQYNQPPAHNQNLPVTASKHTNYGKQKKNRKSPVPGEFENSTSREDVQSPAYSDISDDSTPVTETEINDKSQPPKHPDMKKPSDSAPSMPPLGGYGMYQFYSQQPYMVPPDHPASKPVTSQPPLPPSSSADYNKNKEPPLDLMTKPLPPNEGNVKEANAPTSSGPVGPIPQKPPMSHFYPFNYIPPGYSYNMDPNYGPVSMVSEENKLNQVPISSPMKEERRKETPSPHEHGKLASQVRTPPTGDYGKLGVGPDHNQQISSKLVKTEPSSQKDIKSDPGGNIPMHPKEPTVQSLGGYPGMYQRHSIGVPSQPPQHLTREEELRRYYIYPPERRINPPPSTPGQTVPPVSIKEEPPSPSQSSLPPHSVGSLTQSQQNTSQIPPPVQNSSTQQQQQSQQQNSSSQQKNSKSNVGNSQQNNQKPTNLIKDSKDDKELIKVKQEGQKPTMETQGPPPPPTSQYFLHPSYISPGPFGFDPGHPMYRNVLMSAGPYNTPPYHLPMARFHAPEDLSRNPNTKALDALHHAASQYYNTHKIHELSERALKSPTSSNGKVNVSSPNVSQQNIASSNNPMSGSGNAGGGPGGGPGGILPPSSAPSGGPMNLQPPTGSIPTGMSGGNNVSLGGQKSDRKSPNDPSNKGNVGVGGGGGGVGGGVVGSGQGADSRSPPPQRHVHTHHHTHVGLGYPMYPAPYGAAVLASQQAAAVAVINPFPPGPPK